LVALQEQISFLEAQIESLREDWRRKEGLYLKGQITLLEGSPKGDLPYGSLAMEGQDEDGNKGKRLRLRVILEDGG